MRIYLDTNVLPLDGSLDAIELTALTALAGEHGHELVLPSIVLMEAEAHRLANVRVALDQLHQAVAKVSRYTFVPEIDIRSSEELAAQFREALRGRFDVVDLAPGAAEEALRREAFRQVPAGKKGGARDAAIWLTIKADHVRSANETALVTQNTSDFSDPSEPTALHPELIAELGEHAARFRYYASTAALIAALATPMERQIDVEVLDRSPVVQEVIQRALIDWGGDRRTFQLTHLPTISQITRSRWYQLPNQVFALLSSIWNLEGIMTETTVMASLSMTSEFRGTLAVNMWLRFDATGQGPPVSASLQAVTKADIEYSIPTRSIDDFASLTAPVYTITNLATPGLGHVANLTTIPATSLTNAMVNNSVIPYFAQPPAPPRIWTPLRWRASDDE